MWIPFQIQISVKLAELDELYLKTLYTLNGQITCLIDWNYDDERY